MAVVNVSLDIPNDVYKKVLDGTYILGGLVKDADNKKIVKHLPQVFDSAKEGAKNALKIAKNHKKELWIVGGVLIVGGTIVGTAGYVRNKDQRKAEKEFASNLKIYLESAKEGTLTIEILDNLINSISNYNNRKEIDDIDLKISASQFNELINCLFEYTKHFAEANNINSIDINKPKALKNKNINDLEYYLNLQKHIFEQAA